MPLVSTTEGTGPASLGAWHAWTNFFVGQINLSQDLDQDPQAKITSKNTHRLCKVWGRTLEPTLMLLNEEKALGVPASGQGARDRQGEVGFQPQEGWSSPGPQKCILSLGVGAGRLTKASDIGSHYLQ